MNAQVYLITVVFIIVSVSIISAIVTFKLTKENLKKQIKLDVTFEQMMKSENNISKFLEKNKLNTGESIESIAKILNVEKGGIEKDLNEQAFLKEVDKEGRKIVVFKAGLSEKEERFVFAHEIAHLLNGDPIPVTRPDKHNKEQIEQLADYTAAALLMPLEEVYNFLNDNCYTRVSAKKRVAIIHKLCSKYEVTEIIALRRVKEIYELKQL